MSDVSTVVRFVVVVLVTATLGLAMIQTYKSSTNATVNVQVYDNTTNTYKTQEIPFNEAVSKYPLLKMTLGLIVMLISLGAGILIFRSNPSVEGTVSYFVGAILIFAFLPHIAGAMSSIMSANAPEFALFTTLISIGVPVGLFSIVTRQLE